jgi:hypothetical protein
MITEMVTLRLPEPLYRTARQVADATHQPLDAVLQASIAHALPPLDDVSGEEAAELARLALLDDGALWRVARAEMSAEEQAEMNDLLDRQSAGNLAPAKQVRLQALMDLYGRLMVQKAHANLLLARRGYRVPQQENLE